MCCLPRRAALQNFYHHLGISRRKTRSPDRYWVLPLDRGQGGGSGTAGLSFLTNRYSWALAAATGRTRIGATGYHARYLNEFCVAGGALRKESWLTGENLGFVANEESAAVLPVAVADSITKWRTHRHWRRFYL